MPARALGSPVALRIAQVLLLAAFGTAGFMKLTSPLGELVGMMPWVSAVPGGLVRFIGAAEIAGALGVVLPAATRVRPGLTPIAALGLLTIMVLAAIFDSSAARLAPCPSTPCWVRWRHSWHGAVLAGGSLAPRA